MLTIFQMKAEYNKLKMKLEASGVYVNQAGLTNPVISLVNRLSDI